MPRLILTRTYPTTKIHPAHRCRAAGPALGPASRSAAEAADTVDLRILAINDFHGYLRPSPGGIRIADPADKTKKIMVPAGGAEHMATLVKQLREGHKQHDLRRRRRPDRRQPVAVGDVS